MTVKHSSNAVPIIVSVNDESPNLPACLDHLRSADEVYVVDSQSTDGTD